MHDATDQAVVFVDSDTGIPTSEFVVASAQSFTGILAVFDQGDDGIIEAGDYRLMPRSAADVN